MCNTRRAVLYVWYSPCGTRCAVLNGSQSRDTPSLTPDKTRRYFRQVAVHFYDYNLRALIRGSRLCSGWVGVCGYRRNKQQRRMLSRRLFTATLQDSLAT
ncbi:hypothetical protein NP493_1092g00047 [Ridgeia piscesae]|uniref:Uncharacterized protein n=1 Tax=Ridgeia piscesae TaxID=27915 RepID=A0AAD9NI47_RIDPI|nr:hypothetical protein NP493_1092g00047 [Ridgeia piscesae]